MRINCNGSVVALSTQIDSKYYLELWYCSNYHWFLKQRISYQEALTEIIWDIEKYNILYTLQGDKVEMIKIKLEYICNEGEFGENTHTVGMIDGGIFTS